jgi:hypothetical protein
MEPQEFSNPPKRSFVERIIRDTNSQHNPIIEQEFDPSRPLSGKQKLKHFIIGVVFLGFSILAIVCMMIAGLLSGIGLGSDIIFGTDTLITPLLFGVIVIITGVRASRHILKGLGLNKNPPAVK